MNKSKIEWTNYTWNPISGCLHECEYWYARKIAERFGLAFAPMLGDVGMEGACKYDSPEGMDTMLELNKPYYKNGRIQPYPMAFLPTFHKYRLEEPARKTKSQNIFVCSIADLFGEWVPDEWIEDVFKACVAAPQHRYLFLTKNPKRYETMASYGFYKFWFGVSASGTQTANEALYYLGKLLEFQKTFLSIEPLHNEIKFAKNFKTSCDWVVVGSETGNRKNKVIPEREWIESIIEQCKDANVPLFMKNSLKDIWKDPLIQEFPWEE